MSQTGVFRHLFLIITLGLAIGSPAMAGDSPIAVGEVHVESPSGKLAVDEFRSDVAEELRAFDASKLPPGRRFILTAAVSEEEGDQGITAQVTTSLRDAPSGSVRAVIKAGASAKARPSARLRRAVARQALRGAIVRLPDAIQ